MLPLPDIMLPLLVLLPIVEILYSSCDCKIMLLMLSIIFMSNAAIVVPSSKFIICDHPVNAA